CLLLDDRQCRQPNGGGQPLSGSRPRDIPLPLAGSLGAAPPFPRHNPNPRTKGRPWSGGSWVRVVAGVWGTVSPGRKDIKKEGARAPGRPSASQHSLYPQLRHLMHPSCSVSMLLHSGHSGLSPRATMSAALTSSSPTKSFSASESLSMRAGGEGA